MGCIGEGGCVGGGCVSPMNKLAAGAVFFVINSLH